MPDSNDYIRPAAANPADDGKASVLLHLVQRLKSQPLLLALGVLLILAGVASASLDSLRALLPAAIAVFVVAVVAWVTVEIVRMRRAPSAATGEDVRVSARRVGQQGEVLGMDDSSDVRTGGSTAVNIKADDVQGKVIGIRRGGRRS